ncbi:potassium channel family protein [Candidatus Electrothrix sp.]|uniref:potassium channel family protein n=1 Tax=Candidatus Electrothrix sp. TaxID=2170559 RepID=UPI0040573CA8
MKSLPVFIYFLNNRTTKRNFFVLSKFIAFLIALVSLYSVLFHLLMLYEGREFSWITGFYWSLTVMSTLGFGDITFQTDLGLFFTLVVLLSGVIFLLILLPFTFVQFFYQPWLEAQQKARTPKELPQKTAGHIILTSLEPMTMILIKKLQRYGYQYVLIEPDVNKAQKLHEEGYTVVVGEYDDPETYKRLRLAQARLVVATNDDLTNTSIGFTIREVTHQVPIITNADNVHSVDILEFSGNTKVFQFTRMLGHGLAGRINAISLGAGILGNINGLMVAEFSAVGTVFEGQAIWQTGITEKTGLRIVGIWQRGAFIAPQPETVITAAMVLMLAGLQEQFERYDTLFQPDIAIQQDELPILILGGGRVGKAAAETLDEYGLRSIIVEKDKAVVKQIMRQGRRECLLGDAADIDVLRKAGIEEARTVLITTRNDAVNIYLAFYCRKLRSQIEIISRALETRSVSRLYRAGADLVISAASLGANAILQELRPNECSMFTEGVSISSRIIPNSLVGKTLAEALLKKHQGYTVLAVQREQEQIFDPPPETELQRGDRIILIGTEQEEEEFWDITMME